VQQRKKKEKIDWRIVVTGLLGLTAIEITALCNGIDGKLMTAVIGIIGLVIGVVIPNPIKK
jgi:uncharacterized membrane protein YeaQ/YmgE (transglycosylase-associated protein family)